VGYVVVIITNYLKLLLKNEDLSKHQIIKFLFWVKKGIISLKKKFTMINKEIIYNRDDISTMFLDLMQNLFKDVFIVRFIDEVILYHNHYINTATQVKKKRFYRLSSLNQKYK
jgi:F-type H+-transporting ATPase subunit gamma